MCVQVHMTPLCVCVLYVRAGLCTHALAHLWNIEGNLRKSVLHLYLPRNWI